MLYILFVNYLILLIILPFLFFNNNAVGQTLESINEKYHTANPRLEVGLEPNEVKVDKFLNKVYVANERSNSISVLDSNLGTLKEIFIDTIPHDVEVNDKIHHVYISGKSPSKTISILDGRTDRLIQNISLIQAPLDIEVNEKEHSVYIITGKSFYKQYNDTGMMGIELNNKPRTIEVNENTNIVYVISDSDISIINGTTNNGTTNVKIDKIIPLLKPLLEIEVNENTDIVYVLSKYGLYALNEKTNRLANINSSESLSNIEVNENTDIIYVTSEKSNGLFAIHGPKHNVAVGITFNTSPLNSGRILCGDSKIDYPINQYLYEEPGINCIAKPNDGYEFVGWNENIDSNSTRPLRPCIEESRSFFDSVTIPIQKTLKIYNNTAETSFCITQYGKFTASFRELPAPLPTEYWIPLYGLIVSTILGASIPSIIGWAKIKADIKKSNLHHIKIKSLYDEGRRDENDFEALNKLKNEISDSYLKGKINEFHYSNLKYEVSMLYQEIFMRKIDPLDNHEVDLQLKLKLVKDIKDAYSKGKLTELHYNMLINKISEMEK